MLKALDSNLRQIQISDAELIRAIAHGDEQAFTSLYYRYDSILFGFLLRILSSNTEAEDTLQEVFSYIWKHAASYDETRGRAFTWLVTIARSRALDHLRVIRSRDRRETEASHDRPVAVSHVMDDVIRAEQREMVRAALDDITADQRCALLLAYFEGLSQSEIAKRIGKPIGTVKTRTRDGLRKLRGLLHKRMRKEM